MMSTNEYDVRLSKRQELIDMGIVPYASRWDKDQTIAKLIQHGSELTLRSIEEILTSPKQIYSTAGRMMLKRVSGKLAFAQLQDETGMIQLMFEYQHSRLCTPPSGEIDRFMWDSTKPFDYLFLDKMVEVWDWIGVKGELFITHKWELTLFVSDYQLLSKALRPLGDKFHGIWEDQEKAYRQRYLDMIFNRDTLDRMKFRSDFIKTLRQFYRSQWFMEIDCPVLIPSASGAAARPFVTHHNDFDMNFYLRICNEIELKKATVGWLEKVFTIATNFRNEGSDPSHLQEFVMLEHQNVFRSFHEDMQFTEQMFDYLFDHLHMSRLISIKDKNGIAKQVDFTTPRPKIDYVQWLNQASGLDITSYTIDNADILRQDIKSKGIEFDGMQNMGTMTLIDYLYKKVLRPSISGPAFIYNYPSIIAPLARITDDDPHKCEKRQVVVNGWEIINSYGELVDPVRQKANFAEQSKAEEWWDLDATSADLEFVKVMEYGMPVQAGFGMWIDRVITLLTQQDNLRDVVMFPLMKPDNAPQVFPTSNQTTKICENAIDDKFVDDAMWFARKHLISTLGHCQQVAHCMRYFARKWGKSPQEQNYRYVVWLLHDLDWDVIDKDPATHLGDTFVHMISELSRDEDLQTSLISDIRSHYPQIYADQWYDLSSQLRKYLISIDELSGLMYAYARMRGGSFEGMDATGVIKKIKDTRFAAGVNREHVKYCETVLNTTLEEFIDDMIVALQSYQQ